MELRDVDLNLLVAVKVLLEERHVTRSAERVGVSQPAMSAALARARVLFGDPLLVRGSKGLVLTPHAEQVLKQLADLTMRMDALITRVARFDPRTSTNKVSLVGTDFLEELFLPRLLAALAEEAPGIEVHWRAPDFVNLEPLMASGELDLGLGFCPGIPAVLQQTVVFAETFACIARRDHPAVDEGKLTLDAYVEQRHVQALPRGTSMYASAIDAALAALGLVRRVSLWQPSFLAIPAVVERTDLLATIPRRLARRAATRLALVVHELPFALPAADIAAYWHPRHQEDVGHRWLRQRVVALLRQAAEERAGYSR